MSIYKFKKDLLHQPRPDMCLPTAIKIVIDEQFSDINLSLKNINKWSGYDGKYGTGTALDFLEEQLKPKLKKYGILYKEKDNANIEFLEKLLNKKILPIVNFHLKDYNKWKKKTNIDVDSDEGPTFHSIVVVKVDTENQKVYLYDPLYEKYKKYDDENEIFDELSFSNFYTYWKNELFYLVIWFEDIRKDKSLKKIIEKENNENGRQ